MSGRARGERPGRMLTLGFVLVAGALVAASAEASSPHVDYMLHCQGCHLPDGGGRAGSVPSLRDSIGLFTTVPGGRAFLIRVPGSASSPLSDAALAEVLNWMIERFGPAEVAADFEAFDAAEIARHRSSPLVHVERERSALLDLIARARRAEVRPASVSAPPGE